MVSVSTGTVVVPDWTGDIEDGVTDGKRVEDAETTGVVVPDSIGEDGVTEGEGADDCETRGVVVPDSIGEDEATEGEGVEDGTTTAVVDPDCTREGEDAVTDDDSLGAVESGTLSGLEGYEGTTTGALLLGGANELEA